jgi:3-deoxy-manno-octulosonate cytidylyltransferase (CMP-KDO synthetase)
MLTAACFHSETMLKVAAVIPAHLASIRFPRKVLFPFFGLPMLEHVRRRALLCSSLSEIHVATCDGEIAQVVRAYGGSVIITAPTHANGTSRVAEAIAGLDCSHVVLLQGDEPLLLPRHLDAMVEAIAVRPDGDVWNATGEIAHADELDRHSFVKCAVTGDDRIMYCFRRSPSHSDFATQQTFVRKIMGIIAYRRQALTELALLPPSPIEVAELIEQLRVLANGYSLTSVPVTPSLPSVNEPEEVELVLEYVRRSAEQRELLQQTTP